jgi:hypothetical protein
MTMRPFGVRFMLLSCVGLALAAPLAASAASKNFVAVLNGGQEVPPNSSGSVGTGFFALDTSTGMLCYAISYTALTSAETDAHIHGPDVPFTKHPNNIIVGLAPLGNPMQGCVGPLTGPQMADLKKGLYYVNVHTANNTAGEIRGQLTPVKGK